jgi:hypothetical protein
VRRAEAAPATDSDTRARLREEAGQAAALGETLVARAAELAEADEARAQ